ncbi:MAG: U32 family peptidase, partial [Lachnospiraceae bacterium]|nr:U32 family peptidase [Lachnospiraceae bacterium]
MKKQKVEILAPAGSFESMVAAVNAGADAVYIGGSRFGARAYANNLDEEMMIRAIDYVHLHGAKIYMTVNTLVKEKELPDLYDYLKPYYEAGLDAVIVQDLGVFAYIREHFPDMDIHVSTQMTVTGKYSAAKLKEMGAVRVVPARELTLGEIRDIYDETGLEIETFVHGALCYCYSGQCLFSSLIGGRSGNRGRCAQPCRLPFDVVRDGRYINKKNEKYVLSLKDLCTLDLIPDILEAGVCSLKIEGRMKSPRYTAGVVSIYRKYVDLYLKNGRNGYKVDPADKRMLLDLFDRGGQSEGFYRVHNGRDMVVLKEKPAFREGNQELFEQLDRLYVDAVKKEKIQGTAYFEVGKPARLTLTAELTGRAAENEKYDAKSASAASVICWVDGDIVEEAKNAPMDEARIRKQLMKTGDSPFEFEKLDITIKGNIFVPVQALNSMRREALEGLEKGLLEGHKRQCHILSSQMQKKEIELEEMDHRQEFN